ncbi:MAG: AAA family ATPase, partial [candidate division Zixibacteria bacterium]|nr:AAA family ATPase [Gammaproteobacteria bacterium]NIX54842.1 AAA family ATPase [candidate division Zixibacteria bacterium]
MPEADPPVIPTDFFAGKTPMPFELSVFVAREAELARLNIFLDQVQKGAGKNVFITGDAGSGKTSLITEFIRLAQEAQPNLIVASGTCNAQTGMGDPYLPFREILELLTGDIKARWDAGAISESHARSLWENVPTTAKALVENGSDLIDTLLPGAALLERAQAHYTEPVEWYQRLSELVSERKSNPYLPHPHQSTYFEQYTRVLQTISRQNPLVLVIDDLQWADLGSISLLFHLGRHLSGYPIMVIGAYRPEEVTISRNEDRHPLVPVVRELQRIHGDITINLDQAENREFIEAYLDSEPNHLKQAFRDMLFRQTRGHPLFVIEFLQGLQERGDLIQDEDGFWTEGENLDWETLPARVEAVITERIDRLSPGMQKALYIASVEGDQFTAEVISKILSASKQDFLSQLSNDIDRKHRLIKAQSIQRIDGQMLSCYRFRHIQIQKFLYSNLDQVERAHFHEKIGRTLEELYHVKESITHPADLSSSVTPIVQLAHHFEKAGLINKAVKYLHLAGEKAVQLSAYQDANIHLNKGLELLKLLPESPERLSLELSLLLALGKTMKGLKGMAPPEVEKFFTRAHYLSQQVGDLQQRCLIMGELSIIYFVRADFQRSKEFAEETIRMSKEANDPMLIALSHWQMGFVLFTLGEYAKSREHLAKILSEYDPLEYHNQFIFYKGTNVALSAMTYDACCLWCLGYPEQAVHKSKRALEIAEHLNHPFTSAEVFTIAGCILNEMRGDAEGIVKNTDMLMELSDRVGLGWIGAGWLHRGAGLAMLGQIKEGVANSKKGLRKEYSRAAKCFQSLPIADIAYGKAKTGEFKDGLEDINDAIKEMSARNEFYGEPEIYR